MDKDQMIFVSVVAPMVVDLEVDYLQEVA